MVKSLLVALCFGMMVSAANAIDAADLMPCKPAAARYCDHADTTFSIRNLLRCGAILAGISHRIGEPCRAVLRRYGQL